LDRAGLAGFAARAGGRLAAGLLRIARGWA